MDIKTLDKDVDPLYQCRLCCESPYKVVINELTGQKVEGERGPRTPDPGRPLLALGWINHRLDVNCCAVLDVCYSLERHVAEESDPEKRKQTLYDSLKYVESSEKNLSEFLER